MGYWEGGIRYAPSQYTPPGTHPVYYPLPTPTRRPPVLPAGHRQTAVSRRPKEILGVDNALSSGSGHIPPRLNTVQPLLMLPCNRLLLLAPDSCYWLQAPATGSWFWILVLDTGSWILVLDTGSWILVPGYPSWPWIPVLAMDTVLAMVCTLGDTLPF